MAMYTDMLGTTKPGFYLGLTGVYLQSDSGSFRARNNANAADVPVIGSHLQATGEYLELNLDAAGAAADWKYRVQRPAAGMTAHLTLTLPPTVGGANNVLITDGAGNSSWSNVTALGVPLINPTNGVIPYRQSATQLGDSLLSTDGTNTFFTGAIRTAGHPFPNGGGIDLYKTATATYTSLAIFLSGSAGLLTGMATYVQRDVGATGSLQVAGQFTTANAMAGLIQSTYGISAQASNYAGASSTGFFGHLLGLGNSGSLPGSDTHGVHVAVSNSSGGTMHTADVARFSFRMFAGSGDIQNARGLAVRYWTDASSVGAFQNTAAIFIDDSSNLGVVSSWCIDAALNLAKSRWGGSHILGEGVNLELGTTTGTKIGTTALQKLGVFGANPIVQQTLLGSRSDGSALQNLITILAAYGWFIDGTTA